MSRVCLALALSLCTSPVWGDEKPSPDKVRPNQSNGRYSLAAAGDSVVMLDTATGDSWILSKGTDGKKPEWLPILRGKLLPTERTRIPLKQIHATVGYGDLQDVHVLGPLGKLTSSGEEKPRIFMVRAKDIEEARKVTEMAFRGAELDKPLTKDKPEADEQYWAVLYLGVSFIGPSQWLIDAVKREDDRLRVHLHKRKQGGVSFINGPYFYWIPLGKLTPNTYFLEVYDEDQARITIAQRVTVGSK